MRRNGFQLKSSKFALHFDVLSCHVTPARQLRQRETCTAGWRQDGTWRPPQRADGEAEGDGEAGRPPNARPTPASKQGRTEEKLEMIYSWQVAAESNHVKHGIPRSGETTVNFEQSKWADGVRPELSPSMPPYKNGVRCGIGYNQICIPSICPSTIIMGYSKEIVTAGSGQCPKKGDIVTISYSLYQADQLDLPVAQGNARFRVGKKKVIRGVDRALRKMQQGENAVIHIPSADGFGAAGCPFLAINPNTDLQAKVHLLRIHTNRKDPLRLQTWVLEVQDDITAVGGSPTSSSSGKKGTSHASQHEPINYLDMERMHTLGSERSISMTSATNLAATASLATEH